MRVLVFGAGGQLGQALRSTTPYPGALFLDRAGADLRDRGSIAQALHATRPELVINAAAYTAVDRAESDAPEAYAVNEAGPAALAAGCAALGARLIHLSTDHVFDGDAQRPYRPVDATNPRNVYGASKLAGEQRVRETPALSHLIIRTSWLYSNLGQNFLLAMLNIARRGERPRVVADQVGSPTSAWTLADAIWRATRLPDCLGTAHFTDGGAVTRHEFAAAIFEQAAARGLTEDVVPVIRSAPPSTCRQIRRQQNVRATACSTPWSSARR